MTDDKKYVFNTEEMYALQDALNNDPQVELAIKVIKGQKKLELLEAINEQIAKLQDGQ